jgi:hypothetical protein
MANGTSVATVQFPRSTQTTFAGVNAAKPVNWLGSWECEAVKTENTERLFYVKQEV